MLTQNSDFAEDVAATVERTAGFFTDIWEKFMEHLPALLFALAVFVLGLLAGKVILGIVGKALKRSNIDKTAAGFLKSLIKILFYTVLAVITLTLLNVPMTSIVAVIGAAGLAVGLALQNSLSNVAGGFIILFSRSFKSGDYIETCGSEGTVESISILYTKLITPDNKTVYIPNGNITAGTLVNFNECDKRRLDMEFKISSDSDSETARTIVKDLIDTNTGVLKAPEPAVHYGESGVDFVTVNAYVWTLPCDYWNVRYGIYDAAKVRFDMQGVKLPASRGVSAGAQTPKKNDGVRQ
ncbi:MAG: mechanosensitive ion channel family protein [Oscillospiraceae bacterium]|jgi:small conductance mechanosensitive channel|nr:mechanosensitive ion channel family protein [Oscillospiraceae bacterium]